jgi:signal transduction histidine kinase
LKLRTQILLIFLITSAAVVGISGFVYYQSVSRILQEKTINELKTISKIKSDRINSYVKNCYSQFEVLRKSRILNSSLRLFSSDTSTLARIDVFHTLLEAKQDMEGIGRTMVLDSAGEVVISSNPEQTRQVSYGDYISLFQKKKSTVYDYRYNESDELNFVLIGTIAQNYFFVVEYDAKNLFAVTEDYTGLGTTGETLLIGKDSSGAVLYLTPQRFNNKSLVALSMAETDLLKTLGYKHGMGNFREMMDYRGKVVLASVNMVPLTGWSVMTKIDKEEALNSVEETNQVIIITSLFIVLIVFLLMYLFTYFLVRPINELADTASLISEGDYDQRVTVRNKRNELGQLAQAFNDMADNLIFYQEDLKEKLQELDRSNAALDRYAHVVSHDLKTPLNTLEGTVNLLRLELEDKLTPSQKEVLDKMAEQVKRMKGMIRSVLEYAELKQQKGNIEPQDMNEVIRLVKQNINIPSNVEVMCENNLPTIHIERILMVQVFQNLISNAVKYLDKPKGEVKISYGLKDNFHIFCVSDNGPGIPEAHMPRIFDLFQTGNVNKNYESSGIGLSIVKNIIEEKGGRIWVESEKNKGASFFFTIPAESNSN